MIPEKNWWTVVEGSRRLKLELQRDRFIVRQNTGPIQSRSRLYIINPSVFYPRAFMESVSHSSINYGV